MTPDAPESPTGDPDPTPAEPRLVVENTRARGGAYGPAHLVTLAETARDYAEASSSANTRRAYASDWRHYSAWTRRHTFPALPPDPQVLGLYIAACASRAITGKPDSVATLERRISALRWNFAQRGEKFDRADRHVATVLAGVRRTQGRPPEQKEAILPEDLKAMIATLDLGDLRGLRDRAILLVGFAGGLRRSEIVGLDCGAQQTQDGTGWTEILDKGILVTLRGKTGWREVEIGRGSSELSCPIVALEAWLKFARIEHGPLFRRVSPTARPWIPSGWPTSTSPGWSNAPRSPPGCAATWSKANGRGNSPAIRCAPASPPPPRSTNASCRSSSATPRRK